MFETDQQISKEIEKTKQELDIVQQDYQKIRNKEDEEWRKFISICRQFPYTYGPYITLKFIDISEDNIIKDIHGGHILYEDNEVVVVRNLEETYILLKETVNKFFKKIIIYKLIARLDDFSFTKQVLMYLDDRYFQKYQKIYERLQTLLLQYLNETLYKEQNQTAFKSLVHFTEIDR